MTNEELKEKIVHLEAELAEVKEKVEALPHDDSRPTTRPRTFVTGKGM